jgi:proteasome accessory factor B
MMSAMAEEAQVDALERLLNLVGLLLDTAKPLTFQDIRGVLEPYQQANTDSAKRMFERDKDTLRSFGIPLEVRPVEAQNGIDGYRILKDEYYLPEISFTPEELGALLVAASSGGADTEAERGLRKLLFGADGGTILGLQRGPLTVASESSDLRRTIASSASERRRIGFDYRNARGEISRRRVDAYAIVFQAGRWYLVGADRDRDDIRVFRLSRMAEGVEDLGEGTPPPENFRPADHLAAGPWARSDGGAALLAVDPETVWQVEQAFTGARRTGVREQDGWVEVSVPLTDIPALTGMVLGFGPDVEALEPAELRAEIIARLDELVAR